MLSRWLGVFVFSLGTAGVAHADFLPPNNLHLEESAGPSNVTKAQFEAIIARANEIYGPIVESHGATLKIQPSWDTEVVNASANQRGSEWIVRMYGGLARRPEITPDGFAAVVCHELGHHLGGFVFKTSWAANEGQSDYFATLSCLRNMWVDETESNAKAAEIVPNAAKGKCDDVWGTQRERHLCYRLMLAGKSAADLLAALRDRTVDFSEHDDSKVNRTYNGHPDAQCRLDTYVAGALCIADFDEMIIPGKRFGQHHNGQEAEEESALYTCTRAHQYQVGNRPLCWFKPGESR